MANIKNWFTRFETIKAKKTGLLNYINYLKNDDALSHQGNEHRIINIKTKNFFENACNVVDAAYNKALFNRKGGRPPAKYAQSVVVALPFEQQDDEHLKKVAIEILKNYVDEIFKLEKINDEKAKNDYMNNLTFLNIHLKNVGSKIQFNMLLSEYLTQEHKINLTKKKYSLIMKKVVEKVVDREFMKKDNYESQETSAKFKHKINNNVYMLLKAQKELQEQEQALKQQNNEISNTINYYKQLQEQQENNLKEIEKAYKAQKIQDAIRLTKEKDNNAIKIKDIEEKLKTYKIEDIEDIKKEALNNYAINR